jgi:integrase
MEEPKRRERHTGSFWQIGRIWWIQFYSHGQRIRESSHSDNQAVAKRLLRDRLSQVNQRVYRGNVRMTYEQIRDAFIADYLKKRRRSLRLDAEGKPRPLDKVQRLDKYFAGFRVEDINPDSLAKFVVQQKQNGKKDSTINRSLSAMRRMFRLAVKQRKLNLQDVPPFELEEEPEARQGFFKPEQYRALLLALPDYLKPVLIIAYHTGMRSGEVRAIRWSQVDFLEGMIRLTPAQTKGKTKRDIPIFGELKETLLAQRTKRQPDCDYVCFRTIKAGKTIKIGDFRKVWHDRCVKLGYGAFVQAVDASGEPLFEKPRGPRSKAKPKMVYKGLLVHDLRRTGVRNLIRAGVSDKVARAISGHKTRSVFDRYNIVDDPDLKDAGQKLEKYLEKNSHSLTQISDESSLSKDLPN